MSALSGAENETRLQVVLLVIFLAIMVPVVIEWLVPDSIPPQTGRTWTNQEPLSVERHKVDVTQTSIWTQGFCVRNSEWNPILLVTEYHKLRAVLSHHVELWYEVSYLNSSSKILKLGVGEIRIPITDDVRCVRFWVKAPVVIWIDVIHH